MNIETELKYQVNKIPHNYDKKISIIQSYFDGKKKANLISELYPDIDINSINTFRTRIISCLGKTHYILTLKTKSNNGYSRNEYEKEITKEIYNELLDGNVQSVIIKNRYVINYNSYNFEFDEYLNLKTDLKTLEVELHNNDLEGIKKDCL